MVTSKTDSYFTFVFRALVHINICRHTQLLPSKGSVGVGPTLAVRGAENREHFDLILRGQLRTDQSQNVQDTRAKLETTVVFRRLTSFFLATQ